MDLCPDCRRGLHQNQFAEGNPLFGGRPGRVKLYSILASSVEIGELWAEHHLKAHADADPAEGRRKWWSIAGANAGFQRATAAFHNSILLSNSPPRATKNNQ